MNYMKLINISNINPGNQSLFFTYLVHFNLVNNLHVVNEISDLSEPIHLLYPAQRVLGALSPA
jgi:hypothetical protein